MYSVCKRFPDGNPSNTATIQKTPEEWCVKWISGESFKDVKLISTTGTLGKNIKVNSRNSSWKLII